MKDTRPLIVILAFNEEDSIGRVIRDVRGRLDADILVIDDGSRDATYERALRAGARCISLPYNSGIGVAEQTGFLVAFREGYRFMVRIDGDGQHDPDDLQTLLQALTEEDIDIIVGSRYLDGCKQNINRTRRLGTKFLSWLIRRFTSYEITDATCGFRGYSRRAIEAFSQEYPDDFPEVEALMMSHKKGFRLREAPINVLQRERGVSVIRPGVAVYYMSKVMLSLGVSKLRDLLGDGGR